MAWRGTADVELDDLGVNVRAPLFPGGHFRILLARLAFGCASHFYV